jgi:transcriptional regulator with XRE-family HTH domain
MDKDRILQLILALIILFRDSMQFLQRDRYIKLVPPEGQAPDPRDVIDISSSQKYIIDNRSPAEHTANIRDVFVVSMSDLADILGVTRPTAYAWIEGNEPTLEVITRIHRLSRIADRVKGMNIRRMDKLIHRPIINEESLFDLLKTDKDPSFLLESLREISEKEARTRRESKSSGKNLRSLDEVLSESSVEIDKRS